MCNCVTVESARLGIVSDTDADRQLIEQLLSNSDDAQSVLNKLSQLEGQWPFKDDTQCRQTNTRDDDYHSYVKQGPNSNYIIIIIDKLMYIVYCFFYINNCYFFLYLNSMYSASKYELN